MPFIFHKLEGYDGHLIFRELNSFKDIDVQVISKSNEKYMSIMVNRNIIFLDSLQFLKASLDTLVGNLQDRDFNNLMSEFPSDRLDLLRTKNAYPYEWVDSYQRFTYPRLPPKIYIHLFIQVFIHLLIMEKRGKDDGYISYAHYWHLKLVWKKIGFKTFKDFHNHYLKKDVLLLADVFEKFISTSLKYYNLDPCHYFSTPGLSWDAMLKMTKVELERISNADMHLFIDSSVRGY